MSAEIISDYIDQCQVQANAQKRRAPCNKITGIECKRRKFGFFDSCMEESHNHERTTESCFIFLFSQKFIFRIFELQYFVV